MYCNIQLHHYTGVLKNKPLGLSISSIYDVMTVITSQYDWSLEGLSLREGKHTSPLNLCGFVTASTHFHIKYIHLIQF